MQEDVHPCIIKEGKIWKKWENHEDLDEYHNENMESMKPYESLLKAFHRGYQLRADTGLDCPCRDVTLLIDKEG